MLRFSFLLALPSSSQDDDTSSLASAQPSPTFASNDMKIPKNEKVRQHPRYSLRVLAIVTLIISLIINTIATNTFYYYVAHDLTSWAYLPVTSSLLLSLRAH